jgi:hypothetical protein
MTRLPATFVTSVGRRPGAILLLTSRFLFPAGTGISLLLTSRFLSVPVCRISVDSTTSKLRFFACDVGREGGRWKRQTNALDQHTPPTPAPRPPIQSAEWGNSECESQAVIF